MKLAKVLGHISVVGHAIDAMQHSTSAVDNFSNGNYLEGTGDAVKVLLDFTFAIVETTNPWIIADDVAYSLFNSADDLSDLAK